MHLLPNDICVSRFVFNKNMRCFYMPERKIKYLDLTFCLEGSMIYYINDRRIELSGGDAIIIPPNSIRMRYRSKSEIKYASFTVQLPDDASCGELRVIEGCVNGHITYLLEQFLKEWSMHTAARSKKCNALFTYIYCLIEETQNAKLNSHVEKAIKYISKNLFSQISLTELADELFLTPQYLCKIFKAGTGKTIVEHINAERVAFAQNRIASEKTSFAEIATACGFSNYNYFSKIFKEVTGVSPSAYRQKYKNQF